VELRVGYALSCKWTWEYDGLNQVYSRRDVHEEADLSRTDGAATAGHYCESVRNAVSGELAGCGQVTALLDDQIQEAV